MSGWVLSWITWSFFHNLPYTLIFSYYFIDNIGFTSDGVLKLLDFGLCACVYKRQEHTVAYDMTGFTGSLRYMAPEVALRKPYTEKVDVYSFGVIVWQMAKDKVPYNGMMRAELLDRVSAKGERPKMDRSWPSCFCAFLDSCWHPDPVQRPSFADILITLEAISKEISRSSLKRWHLRSNGIRPKMEENTQSSWF